MSESRVAVKGMPEIVPVILCGGSGTRLWPLSRRQNPKQFLKLLNGYSLFQETVKRASVVCSSNKLIVTTGAEHRNAVMEELEEIGINKEGLHVLLEPKGHNTAPAIAAAALQLGGTESETLLLAMPADHLITDHEALKQAIQSAAGAASSGGIVTLGIKPTYACTDYGYIRKNRAEAEANLFKIAEFREKPDRQTAATYVEDGHYLWNCGIFLMRADSYLEKLSKLSPDVLACTKRSFDKAKRSELFVDLDEKSFDECPSISIDYAVMEHTDSAYVVEFEGYWTDLGSWGSLWEIGTKSSDENAIHGDVIVRDVKNSYIHSGGRLIAAIGIRNQVIIDTPDALLVADMNRLEHIKQLVSELEQQQRPEAVQGSVSRQSWGWRQQIFVDNDVEIWRLYIQPGMHVDGNSGTFHSLSWTAVQGEGEIAIGEERYVLESGRAISIASTSGYTLGNMQSTPLEIIEVRSGNADTIQGL